MVGAQLPSFQPRTGAHQSLLQSYPAVRTGASIGMVRLRDRTIATYLRVPSIHQRLSQVSRTATVEWPSCPAFAGEGKDSGCERLIRAVEQLARRGKVQGWQRHARSNFSAEPKRVGCISVTKLLLDYSARFLLTGRNKSLHCQF